MNKYRDVTLEEILEMKGRVSKYEWETHYVHIITAMKKKKLKDESKKKKK